MKNVSIWSTNFDDTTGQSIVTRRVAFEILPRLGAGKRYLFPAFFRPRAITTWIGAAINLWCDVLGGKVETLYVVCSRSNGGFIRDTPALLTALYGVRVIVHAHGSDIVDLFSRRLVSPFARSFYKYCELIVPSSNLATAVKEICNVKVSVCENFVNSAMLPEGVTREPSVHDYLRVLWNSNIMSSKGIVELVSAAQKLNREKLTVEIIAIGNILADEEMSYKTLADKIQDFQRMDFFSYIGPTSLQEAINLSKETDVVALPSRYSSELQPLSIMQAMCCGQGILVSDTPALRETTKGYPVEFADPNSVPSIEDALRELHLEYTMDQRAFVERRASSALEARNRFSEKRFDSHMIEILFDASSQFLDDGTSSR